MSGKELTLEIVQSQMKPAQRGTISEETVSEIQKLAEDPDYGEEFLDCYLDHLNIYKENPNRSHTQYLNAIKFFSLVEAGNSLTDAYIKLFPQRYTDRQQNYPAEERLPSIMRGEASRFNSSVLVTEIKRVASVPVQLIHRHTLHAAIAVQVDLMVNAKSDMVKQKASATLIEKLMPLEDTTINVKVENDGVSMIDELKKAADELARVTNERVVGGMSLDSVSKSKIVEAEIVDE